MPDRDDDADETGRLSADADDDDEQRKDKQMQTKFKSLDAVQICKQISDDGDALSEHQLVEIVDRYAKAHDTTFSKLYEANTPEGLAIRKAVNVAKQAQFCSRTSTVSKLGGSTPHFHAAPDDGPAGRPGRATLRPRQVGGADARAVNNPKSALDELQKLVDQQRAANPTLTEAGAFARVYEDKANAELVRREREENRPVAMGW